MPLVTFETPFVLDYNQFSLEFDFYGMTITKLCDLPQPKELGLT